MKIKNIFLFTIIVIVFTNTTQSQEDQNPRDNLLKLIDETANSTIDVLLDENGKSRCDYNIIEGKWYDYEPPWHTGQIMYGLVEAFKITNNKKYLRSASLAGDWWCNLLITDHP